MTDTGEKMGKLTRVQDRILTALLDRAMDTFDIADKLGVKPNIAFGECCKLKARGYVDWMYPEDEVFLSQKGRTLARPDPADIP